MRVGEKVADSSGFISSPVHASVSGVVKKLDPVLLSNGNRVPAVWIESDGKMTPSRAKYAQKQFIASKEDFLRAVKDSGIVGLGGAGFPTIGKLTFPETAAPDTVIINGAECEPFITSDTRTMLDRPDEIICGLELLRDYLGVRHFIIGIEANKPDCIRYFREVKIEGADFRVKVLPPVYPQGAEKVLIHRTTGRIVPEGKLPIDVGVIVLQLHDRCRACGLHPDRHAARRKMRHRERLGGEESAERHRPHRNTHPRRICILRRLRKGTGQDPLRRTHDGHCRSRPVCPGPQEHKRDPRF